MGGNLCDLRKIVSSSKVIELVVNTFLVYVFHLCVCDIFNLILLRVDVTCYIYVLFVINSH